MEELNLIKQKLTKITISCAKQFQKGHFITKLEYFIALKHTTFLIFVEKVQLVESGFAKMH